MPDEAREVKPFQMFDKGNRSEIDFRPIENFPEPEAETPDPKDLSAPEPVVSSGSPLTIEPTPEQIASAAKASTKLKVNVSGQQTLFEEISDGKTKQPAVT